MNRLVRISISLLLAFVMSFSVTFAESGQDVSVQESKEQATTEQAEDTSSEDAEQKETKQKKPATGVYKKNGYYFGIG